MGIQNDWHHVSTLHWLFFPDHVGNNRMGDAVDDELPVKSLVVTGIALA